MKVVFNQKQHDFPKRSGELNLAWYSGGQVCIVRKKTDRQLQKQNMSIIRINRLCKGLWDGLDLHFKQDLSLYAQRYKIECPVLRNRGVSSYAVFLMLVHALIKRFSLKTDDHEKSLKLLSSLLCDMSVDKAVQYRFLKVVSKYYQLNKLPYFYSNYSGGLIYSMPIGNNILRQTYQCQKPIILCVSTSRLRFTQDDKCFVDLSFTRDDSKRQIISRMFFVR